MDELVEMITCRQCGQVKPASRSTPGWCEACEKAYNNRYSYIRRSNAGWTDIATDSGLELYERQPQETQLEWTVWQIYRDSYPGARMNYRQVAEKAGTTYAFVKTIASRWDFQTRMQAWIAYCDSLTLAQRRREVLDMNADHIKMAKALRDKLSVAIDHINPDELKPSELNSLLKTATDLEKRARLDTVDEETAIRAAAAPHDDNPNLKKDQTQQGDLAEVVSILLKAGALGDITQIGVRKTQTTEVVVKEGG